MNTHPIVLACAAILLAGCGGETELPSRPEPPTATSADSESIEQPQPETEPAGAGEITARLFRRDPGSGEFVGPSLEVYSPSAVEAGDGVMTFRDARVTIFGADEQRTIITATEGQLDQNEETAALTGGVQVQRGTQTISTTSLDWDNEKREAVASEGVRIVDGDTVLEAESMLFAPDTDTLTLQRVTGVIQLPKTDTNEARRISPLQMAVQWLLLATPAYAQATDTAYTHVVIEKPAPEVVLRANKLDRMTGGVEIQLRTADESQPPLILGAGTIVFGWAEGAETELASLELTDDVRVSNEAGQMRAANGTFDVTKMAITFTGAVSGSFEGIDEFEADQLEYNVETGDMTMQNLRAIIPFAEAQGGDAGAYSQMDIQRAARVRIANGRVQQMDGGVDMKLSPAGGGNPINLGAGSFTFGYANDEQTQPDTVTMESGVRVDAPQGLIQSNAADFNVGNGRLKFRGNVRGRSEALKSFTASSFDYNLDSEDGLLQSFRADGVQIGGQGESYDRMDVRRAPEVRMAGGRVTSMSGGVELLLQGAANREPLTAKAKTVTMAYAGGSTTAPETVTMEEEVEVDSGEMFLRSSRAVINMATEIAAFTGGVKANIPGRVENASFATLDYKLATGDFSSTMADVEELVRDDSEEPQAP